MKDLILNNWMAKIMSLLLAITLWFLIKKNVETTLRLEPARPVMTPQPRAMGEPAAGLEPTDKPVKRAIPVDPTGPGQKQKNDSRHGTKSQ